MTSRILIIMGLFIMDTMVSVNSEDVKKLSEKIGDVDKRMFHVEKILPELAENVKALRQIVSDQAAQNEFNRNIERRTAQNESQISDIKAKSESSIKEVSDKVDKNTHSIWKIVAYLAAGVGGGVSIANLFPFA